VTTIGVTTIATLEEIGCGEDEVRAFIIKVFSSERWRGFFRRLRLGGLDWL